MNQNLELCLNQALLSLVAGEYYQANLAEFSGGVTIGSLQLHWQAQGAPVVTIAGGTAQNVSLTFTPIILTGQGIPGSASLTVTVNGTLAIENGVLSLTALVATVTGDAGFINNVIATQVNALIAQQYAAKVASIPIPALQNLLNTQLTVQLLNANLVSGQAQISASLTYQGQAPDGPPPPPICNSLNTPAAGLALNAAAVSTVLATQASSFPKVQQIYKVNEHSGSIFGHFGSGVQGSVAVFLPSLSINGNSATATTTIEFNLQGGVEAFGAWTWVPLPVPPANVALSVGLVTNGAAKQANVTVLGVEAINFAPIDFPAILKPLGDAIVGLIEGAVSNALPGLIVGQQFTIFTLPATLPGTPFPASLSFAQLGFMNSGVGVVVNVTAGAPRAFAAEREALMSTNPQAGGNGNEFFVQLAWNALWQKTRQDGSANPYYLPSMILNGVTSNNVHVDALGTVTVDDIPTVELMQSKDLSPLPFKSGSVGISFSGVTLTGMDSLSNQGLKYTADPNNPNAATIAATIDAGPIQASGNYVVMASGLAMCALDTAGALLSLPGLTAEATAAPADTPPIDTMLDAARTQRTRLWQTQNGSQLMDTFYEHNEVYNQLYGIEGSPLATQWAVPATQANAAATYTATQQSVTVNDSEGVYNGNAFLQALNLHTNCVHAAKNAGTGPYTFDAASYNAAADAVLGFESNVNTTGNSSTQSTPLTVDQVFSAVSTGSSYLAATPPKRTEAELHHIAKFRHALERFDAARAALAASDQHATIFQGPVSLTITGAVLVLNASLDFSGSTPVATVTSITASFAPPTINIDVNAWRSGQFGSIGEKLIPAFENASFLTNLVHDKLQAGIESSTVTTYLNNAVNDALAKILGSLPGGNS